MIGAIRVGRSVCGERVLQILRLRLASGKAPLRMTPKRIAVILSEAKNLCDMLPRVIPHRTTPKRIAVILSEAKNLYNAMDKGTSGDKATR